MNQYQYIYTYNSNDQLTELLSQGWNGSDWEDISRAVISLDSNGNEVRAVLQFWDNDTSKWVNYISETNIYTENRPVEVPTSIKRPVSSSTHYKFELLQNYPNPFNPSTVIRYKLAKTSKVRLTVYDVTGRLVATLINRIESAGSHIIRFNASQLASGIYFYRLQTGELGQTRKMILIH